ncbi:glycoside hydrolase family 2 TIM barrel-domain containing protein [Hymenobacter sp. BRD67]|uniref:glycoside hydrolase family 2 TIM barrel-domain containing protein n=1 Tax=Hymenobacter sp. BRD67 TaxID=2675877 RepID=UPI0015676787|nr:glycoside hydrolase family 2 TIM barrel-domain containing protein [Hymenobacter sp. BRD67]QKG54431.1 beta-galactosidase [Hymenobacter sp. BRD67]
MLKTLSFFLVVLALARPALAQRVVQSINSNWQFCKGNGQDFAQLPPPPAAWERVSIPHTWNITDVLDDQPGYYRGVGWYRKTVFVPATWQGQRIYLHFEGANQQTEVYVNGQLAGRHAGGYTAFRFEITSLVKFGNKAPAANEVLVKVDNSYNPAIPPLTADFTFYGGLYRDVYLLAAAPVHFALDNYASSGLFVTTPAVSATAAQVEVRGVVANETATARPLTLRTRLLDRQGRVVAEQRASLRLRAGQRQEFKLAFNPVTQPHLWSPDDPYLYRVVSSVEEKGKPLDEVSSPLGLRWYRFDAAEGFFLNGKPLKLIGTNRHQDYPGQGNALPDALHERDILLLKQMGGNFLRISHYPQDPALLAACDRLGILASMEIPIVNEITDSPEFFQTCRTMQTEMIRQNFNHPSIIIWAYMNEILLRMPENTRKDDSQRQAYFGRVTTLAKQLDSLTRREDPARYTMIVNNGVFELYHRAGLTTISQLVGWNIYAGWYGNNTKLEDLPKLLDRHHRELPTVPLLVTEYGADADPRLHAAQPVRFDKTQEYANLYHQYYLKEFLARPYVVGSTAWNLADFNSEGRQEANPHINTKSLLTADRQPKDTYLFYQAHLLKTPFTKIGSRAWTLRSGIAAGPDSLFCPQAVEVYTNQPRVRLTLNGHDLGTRTADFGVARFRVPFVDGINLLTAQAPGQEVGDEVSITFQLLPTNLASAQLPFRELNVSLGDQRFFTDALLGQVWVPEQAYTPGGWGYVGGRALVQPGSLPYGSGRNILGTEYDALYETQRVGLSEFRLDVPDGQYEVVLHFAELETVPTAEQLIYNLEKPTTGPAGPVSQTGRAFDVLLNGLPVLTDLGTTTYLAPLQATSFKFPIEVVGGQGIRVAFRARAGEAILNAIQVKRSY